MNPLTDEQYQELLAAGRPLARDGRGVKVFQLADGRMVKIFRRRNLFTSDFFRPYADRFRQNAESLALLGIKTVLVEKVFVCPTQKQHLVLYQSLPGRTLREALADEGGRRELLARFGAFFAQLHGKGVLFRSIHFGNVIVAPENESFALIDIADMAFYRGPLSLAKRVRNFRHMIRYDGDRRWIEASGTESFLRHYVDASLLSSQKKEQFIQKLAHDVAFFRFPDSSWPRDEKESTD